MVFAMKIGAARRWKAPRVLDAHVVAFRLDRLDFDRKNGGGEIHDPMMEIGTTRR